jgi:hypothetical protein
MATLSDTKFNPILLLCSRLSHLCHVRLLCGPLEVENQQTNDAISRISNPRVKHRVQTAAYLLGINDEMPDLDIPVSIDPLYDDACESLSCCFSTFFLHWSMSVKFVVPLNTMKANVPTTSVGVNFRLDDRQDDIMDHIIAYMDLPPLAVDYLLIV